MANLPWQRVFQGEAQARFVLPADLAGRQWLAAKVQAVGQALEAVGLQRAADFDDEFLFQLLGVVAELARHAPVLGEHLQAAGVGVQRQAQGQALEVALQGAHRREVEGALVGFV